MSEHKTNKPEHEHEHEPDHVITSDLHAEAAHKSCCGSDKADRIAVDEKPHTDPVCGMKAATDPAKSAVADDVTYYFCSMRCVEKFKLDPARYLHPEQHAATAAPTPTPAGAMFTCPMHPEIRQDHPGSCPKCGMALEPEMPTLEEGENHELVDFRRRFWWTLPLTMVVTVLAMFGHRFGWIEGRTQSWIELALSLPIVLWAGYPFFERGVRSIVNASPNMFTLIALGTSAAFIYSVVATIAPGLFPASFLAHGRIGDYFEAAAVIISLTLLGQMLELKARSQTSMAIKSLLGLSPKTARRIKPDGSEEDVPLNHVHIGDSLRVRPGEKIPVDCVVSEGSSAVDE